MSLTGPNVVLGAIAFALPPCGDSHSYVFSGATIFSFQPGGVYLDSGSERKYVPTPTDIGNFAFVARALKRTASDHLCNWVLRSFKGLTTPRRVSDVSSLGLYR